MTGDWSKFSKVIGFALLALGSTPTSSAQYNNCTGELSWINDGYCDETLNYPECQHDGGDCCICTCVDSPDYACGINGFACKDPACLDPAILAEFPNCTGNYLLINDGECYAENNNPECGYDGGDCCLCTCMANSKCFLGNFDCVDPSAEEDLYECQPPPPSPDACAADVQTSWVVESSTQARAMTEAVNCSGGTFDVEWRGAVAVEKTINVVDGTFLAITGVGNSSTAVINGGQHMRLFTVINASLYLSDLNISSGSSVVGGAIAASGSNVTALRISFVDNRANGSGGAVYATRNSDIVFDGNKTTFISNSAIGYGGALFSSSTSTVHFNGKETYALYNTAGENGGAIAIDQSRLWVAGKVFLTNNTSGNFGGAIDVTGGSRAALTGSLFFLENTAWSGGGALSVSLNSNVSWRGEITFEFNLARTSGGAVYVERADVSWSGNTSFKYNRATYSGGAIHVDDANVSWSGVSSFVENWSERGGGLYVLPGSSVWWSGPSTVFISNIANSWSGGAVSIFYSKLSWSGDVTFENNQAKLNGGAISAVGSEMSKEDIRDALFINNNAEHSGGALYVREAELSWSGASSFIDNSGGNGGALHISFYSTVQWDASRTVFLSNSATLWFGGAAYIYKSNVSWTGDMTFEHNQASISGGAIYANRSVVSWDSNTAFVSNTAITSSGAVEAAFGTKLSWNGTTSFIKNSAKTGGAMFIHSGSEVNWIGRNTTFISNVATWTSGGAIAIENSNLSWSGVTVFFDNSAESNAGGGIFMWIRSRISCSGDTTFMGNKASYGGAIYISRNGLIELYGLTVFDSNEAEIEGGAIGSAILDASADSEQISYLYIAGTVRYLDNFSQRNGGAISMTGGLSLQVGSTAHVTFQRNKAKAAGGAVFISGADVGPKFVKVIFISNSAQLGGGVYATSSGNAKINLKGQEALNPTIYDNCSFVDNVAVATGGAIQSAAGQDSILHTSFKRNSARVGGALFLGGTSNFMDCSFIDNVSDEGGGPVASNIGYVESMRSSSFTGNDYSCSLGTFRAYETVRSL